MRVIPVLVAVLLVSVAVGGALAVPDRGGTTSAVPDSPTTTTATETPDAAESASTATVAAINGTAPIRVLSLEGNGSVASDIDVVTVDAGTATTFGANASAERIETIALRERIASANTSDERQIRILDGLNEVDKDLITLHSRHREAVAAYHAGEISAREFLIELARVRAEAAVLEDRVRMLDRLAEETDDFALDDSRVFPVVYDLRTFDGPVRSRTTAALEGEPGASTRVYVEATESGIVLSTVADGRYVREAFRGDLRERDDTSIDEETAQNVTARSYPEVWAATGGSVAGQGSGGTFLFDLSYPNGTLTAFVGGGTERVFMEHQRVDLAAVSGGEAVTRTLDLALTVNRTFPGGPLRVAVTDPQTGEPVDAVVKIGREGGESTDVGTTGTDGVLWTVSPRGEFVVTVVEVGSTEVSTINVAPTDAVTVDEAFTSADDSGSSNATG
ncbi:DUF7094 domain-containing protein [Halobaculum magnesiiphilum]|uniref:Uncharacterized protein n=1 Tax=Halobaculum magnesiiphilum TaxID=1017351 RepID=A0A8T8WBM0_9EURY|nr:hypothetical protein [Halobaculum magnesiiphilum]QZP37216.1 hypothetical protein K6T50_13150 [Halobaculum magnesiiphilum]